MTKRISSVPDIPKERRGELDTLLVGYMDCARKERELRSEARAKTAELRSKAGRILSEAEAEEKRLAKMRAALAARFTEAWENEFPDVKSAVFASARVDRTTRRTVNVRDKGALLERLRKLDRLDMVEQIIDERELLALSRTGALDDLAVDVIAIDDVPDIRVRRREED
jgi:hypothetical protein